MAAVNILSTVRGCSSIAFQSKSYQDVLRERQHNIAIYILLVVNFPCTARINANDRNPEHTTECKNTEPDTQEQELAGHTLDCDCRDQSGPQHTHGYQ